mgnify:FL=1
MQYALIESGTVTNIAEATAEAAAQLPGQWVPAPGAGIGWAYAKGKFTPPAAAAQAPEPDWRVSRLAFRKRFTQAEKVALELAALDDPAAAPAQRAQAAAMRAYLKDVDAAAFINLADPDTAAGVQTLEAAGLLPEGRAAQILTTPVAPDEAP